MLYSNGLTTGISNVGMIRNRCNWMVNALQKSNTNNEFRSELGCRSSDEMENAEAGVPVPPTPPRRQKKFRHRGEARRSSVNKTIRLPANNKSISAHSPTYCTLPNFIQVHLTKFSDGSLGFEMSKSSRIMVKSVCPSMESVGKIMPGDEIISLNGKNLRGFGLLEVNQLLKDSPPHYILGLIRSSKTLHQSPSSSPTPIFTSKAGFDDYETEVFALKLEKKIPNMCYDKPVIETTSDHPIPLSPSLSSSLTETSHLIQEEYNEIWEYKRETSDKSGKQGGRYCDKIVDLVKSEFCAKLGGFKPVQDLIQDKKSFLEVSVKKNVRGIGISVCGGKDSVSDVLLDRFIRIKKLFPADPAHDSGLIHVGDIILAANQMSLLTSTTLEAVNLLHSLSHDVNLFIFKSSKLPLLKINTGIANSPSPIPDSVIHEPESPVDVSDVEFDIEMTKKGGTLGFTIIKIEGEGLFVKELTKEPALSDARIAAADKLILVNNVNVSTMSHSSAISFLRSLPDKVKLRLKRSKNFNDSQLVSSMDSLDRISSFVGKKKSLREEAKIMILDKNLNNESLSRFKKIRERRKTRECSFNNSADDDSVNGDADISHGEKNAFIANHDMIRAQIAQPKSFNYAGDSKYSHKVVELDDGCLINKLSEHQSKQLFNRQFSVNETRSRNLSAEETEKDNSLDRNFMRWRGTNLASAATGASTSNGGYLVMRDEQDSGFGEAKQEESLFDDSKKGDDGSVDNVNVVNDDGEKEDGSGETGHFFITTLDRGWHGRLGFSLKHNEDGSACIVKEIFPNSVASKDGVIKIGDKLIDVNGESMLHRPSAHVIDDLRKMKGKLKMLFYRIVKESDL